MHHRTWKVIAVLFVLLLPACMPEGIQIETAHPTAYATTEPTSTASPATHLMQWKDIQAALAAELLPLQPVEEVICEWEILGESGSTLFVWAVCFGAPPADRPEEYAPRASIPAVITMNEVGTDFRVDIPEYGSSYADGVHDLFPAEIQELIFHRAADIAEMAAHAVARRTAPEPPLIVLMATPQP